MLMSSMELLPNQARIQRFRARLDSRLGALDADDDGELIGGGAAYFWSPETTVQQWRAAAPSGSRRERDSEGEGANEGVLEHHKLTLSAMVMTARPGMVGRRRIDDNNLGNWRRFGDDSGEVEPSLLACFGEDDEGGKALPAVASAHHVVVGDGDVVELL